MDDIIRYADHIGRECEVFKPTLRPHFEYWLASVGSWHGGRGTYITCAHYVDMVASSQEIAVFIGPDLINKAIQQAKKFRSKLRPDEPAKKIMDRHIKQLEQALKHCSPAPENPPRPEKKPSEKLALLRRIFRPWGNG